MSGAVNPYLLANLTDVARFIVQNGKYIVNPTLSVNGNGPASNVPVMNGFIRDDGPLGLSPNNLTNVTVFLTPSGFDVTPIIDELCPIPSLINATLNASSSLATDNEFRCLDEATACSAVLHGVWPKAYVFTFNRKYGGYDPDPPMCEPPPTEKFP